MALRLPWEINEGQTLAFAAVKALLSPRPRLRTGLGKNVSRHMLGVPTGFDEPEGAQEELLLPKKSRKLMHRTGLHFDRAKNDFLQGAQALLSGRREEATLFFRRAARKDDLLADAHYALALCTADATEQLLAADRAFLHRHRLTGLSKEYGLQFCALLLACDGKRLRLMSDLPGLELLTAEVYQAHDKREDAIRVLEASSYAELDIFRFSGGETLFRLQRYEQAIDQLKRVLHNRLLAGPASYLLGFSLEKLGYDSAAMQVFRDALSRETISHRLEVELRFRLYLLMQKEGFHGQAVRELERLVALEPGWKELVHEWRGHPTV